MDILLTDGHKLHNTFQEALLYSLLSTLRSWTLHTPNEQSRN